MWYGPTIGWGPNPLGMTYWDIPVMLIALLNNAIAMCPRFRGNCKLDSVQIVQRFITEVYINGVHVHTVYWTVSATWYADPGLGRPKPVIGIQPGGYAPGTDPNDIVRGGAK